MTGRYFLFRIGLLWALIGPGNGTINGADFPRILNFPKELYLAENQNWSVAQGADGIMYFGNNSGLLEYDGLNWSVHPFPEGQVVRTVAVEGERIYAGGYGEFGYWSRDQLGALQYFSLSSQLPERDIGTEIWHILPTARGVFLQSFGSVFRLNDGLLEKLDLPGNLMFLHEVNGRIMVQKIGGGLFELMPDGNFEHLSASDFFRDKNVIGILPHAGSYLVCTSHHGIFQHTNGAYISWKHPVNAALEANQLNKAILLQNGRIALGTILGGVFIVNGLSIEYHINQDKGLQNNTVLYLFEDTQKDLWLGLDNGIDLIELSNALRYFDQRQGQIGAVYTAIVHEGLFYVGTNQGVYYRSWPLRAEEAFRFLDGTQGQVWQLAVFDGQLLCGHNEGTFLVRGTSAKRISEVTGGWTMVRPETDSRFLLQGTYTGVVVFQPDANGQWAFSHRVQGIQHLVQKLVPDETGFWWAVNPNAGVFRLKFSDDFQQILMMDTIRMSCGLPTNLNLDILPFKEEVLIWSQGAYFHWDPESRRCSPIDLGGLLMPEQKQPWKVWPGQEGDFFFLYQRHIVWRKKNGQHFQLPVGLIKYNENIVLLPDGSRIFCLDNGYALWPADGVEPTIEHMKPFVKEWKVQRQKNGSEPLQSRRPLVFSAQSNNLHMVFAAPYFSQKPLLRYRLLGFEQEWSDWQDIGSKEFSNLPPGRYVLEVQSTLGPSTAKMDFGIAYPWYKNPWINLFYAFLLGGFFWALYRLHHYRLAMQTRRLLLEKERQLQQQRIQARNEQLQADILNKSTELANSTFNLIRKNETLLQVKEALEKWKKSAKDNLPDQTYRQMIHLLESHLSDERDWQLFETNFNQVHEVFFKQLKAAYPDLTPGDLRLAAYLKMNLSSKEIAPLLNISIRGVENKRYRLRQKLHLDPDDNLTGFLINY